jgi:hypothetical protein
MFLVVIPLGEIMFAGFAHESIKADCSRRSFDGSPSGLLLIRSVRPQSLGFQIVELSLPPVRRLVLRFAG